MTDIEFGDAMTELILKARETMSPGAVGQYLLVSAHALLDSDIRQRCDGVGCADRDTWLAICDNVHVKVRELGRLPPETPL